MNIDSVFGSFLKAADLQGRAVRVVISSIEIKDFGEDGKKVIMRFHGKDKGMVVNKTNASMLKMHFGPETDRWIGQTVELFAEKVMFQGSFVDGLRVRVPAPVAGAPVPKAAPPQASPPPAVPDDFGDTNIPF